MSGAVAAEVRPLPRLLLAEQQAAQGHHLGGHVQLLTPVQPLLQVQPVSDDRMNKPGNLGTHVDPQ